MTDAIMIFKDTNKGNLIRGYREWLRQNKKWGTKKEGFKTISNLQRPKINDVYISWKAFGNLPKESIIVHVFTEGCDAEYLNALQEAGFYNKVVPLARKTHSRFVYYPNSKTSFKGYHWCEKKCCGKSFVDKKYTLYKDAVTEKAISRRQHR